MRYINPLNQARLFGRPLMRDTAEQLICEEKRFVDLVKEAKYPEGEVGWESLRDQATHPEDPGGAQGPIQELLQPYSTAGKFSCIIS